MAVYSIIHVMRDRFARQEERNMLTEHAQDEQNPILNVSQ